MTPSRIASIDFLPFELTMSPQHEPPPPSSSLSFPPSLTGVQYVVILTKADKKDGKVSPLLQQQVADALDSFDLKETTPVIATSAVNRLGRDEVWRYLRLAVIKEGK